MNSVNRSISFKIHSRNQLLKIAHEAVQYYSGDVDSLNAAVGFLFTGYYFGWRFIVLAHDKKTIRKYELILDIKVRESFGEFGEFSSRSPGLNEAMEHSNFWKCVSGDIKISERKTIYGDEEAKLLSAIKVRDSLSPELAENMERRFRGLN